MKPRKFDKPDRPFKKFRRDVDPSAPVETRDKPYKPAFRKDARPTDRQEFGEELLYATSGKVAEVVGTMPLDRHEILRRMWRYYMQDGLVKPLPGGPPRAPRERDDRPARAPRAFSGDRPRTFERAGEDRPRSFSPRPAGGSAGRYSRRPDDRPARPERGADDGPRRYSRGPDDRPARPARSGEDAPRRFSPRGPDDGPKRFSPRGPETGPRKYARKPAGTGTFSRKPAGKHPTVQKKAMIDKAPRRNFKDTRERNEE